MIVRNSTEMAQSTRKKEVFLEENRLMLSTRPQNIALPLSLPQASLHFVNDITIMMILVLKNGSKIVFLC